MADTAKAPAESPAAEPTTVAKVKAVLLKRGYTEVKKGAVNTPGFDKIHTFLKRGRLVYLVYNAADDWDIIESIWEGSAEPSLEEVERMV